MYAAGHQTYAFAMKFQWAFDLMMEDFLKKLTRQVRRQHTKNLRLFYNL